MAVSIPGAEAAASQQRSVLLRTRVAATTAWSGSCHCQQPSWAPQQHAAACDTQQGTVPCGVGDSNGGIHVLPLGSWAAALRHMGSEEVAYHLQQSHRPQGLGQLRLMPLQRWLPRQGLADSHQECQVPAAEGALQRAPKLELYPGLVAVTTQAAQAGGPGRHPLTLLPASCWCCRQLALQPQSLRPRPLGQPVGLAMPGLEPCKPT